MKKKGVGFGILLIFVILVAVLVGGKDFFIRVGVEQAVKAVTGLPLKIERLKIGISTTLIDIRGMRLYNPPGFDEHLMIDIPEIYVDYSLPELLAGKVHATDVRLELADFIVVKNKEGAVNLNYLKTLQEKMPAKKPTEGAPAPTQPAEKKVVPVQIDNLTLKIKKVTYKDYSKGGAEPVVKEIPMNIDETYKDIKDLNTIIALIVVKTVTQTALANLPGLDSVNVEGLNSLVTGTFKGAKDSGKVIVTETADTLKKTTDSITDIFKKPFGDKSN